jgi:hypothetical protein
MQPESGLAATPPRQFMGSRACFRVLSFLRNPKASAWAMPMPEDKDIRVIQVSETHFSKLRSRRDALFTGGSAIGPESEADVALATICGDLKSP